MPVPFRWHRGQYWKGYPKGSPTKELGLDGISGTVYPGVSTHLPEAVRKSKEIM